MFQENVLKARMVLVGYNVSKLAKEMEISRVALYSKMSSGKFYRGEIAKIAVVLGLSDEEIINIFFCR